MDSFSSTQNVFPPKIKALVVPLVEDVPVIRAVTNGQPTRLSDYDVFITCKANHPGNDDLEQFTPEEFFRRYIPSRLYFQGAGHG